MTMCQITLTVSVIFVTMRAMGMSRSQTSKIIREHVFRNAPAMNDRFSKLTQMMTSHRLVNPGETIEFKDFRDPWEVLRQFIFA